MTDELPLNHLLADRKPFRRAYVWWCGDEVCDCYQARIEHLRPNPAGGWFRETVWKGAFITDGGYAACLTELSAEADRRGLPLGDSYRTV